LTDPAPPVRGRVARRLASLAWAERRWLALGTFFLAVSSSATLAFPTFVGSLLDGALTRADAAELDRVAWILGGVFVVQGVAGGLRGYIFNVTGERVVAGLRSTLYRRLVAQEIGFFDQTRTGELLGRLASDTAVLQNTVSVNVSIALRHTVTVLGGLVMLWWTSRSLTAIMLSVVPAVAVGAVWFGRIVRRLSRGVQDALAQASEVAEESLSAMRTVRSFNQESGESARYARAIDASFALSRRRALMMSLFAATGLIGGYGSVGLVLWSGGHRVLSGDMSAGALTSFLVYTLMVAFSMAALAGLYADLVRAVGAAGRVFELLDRTPDTTMMAGEGPHAVVGRVEVQDVTFRYPARPDVRALDGMTLTLEPGTVTALVGPSGGGKSTLAALLCRWYDPDGGCIRLDGEDLRVLDGARLRDFIGVVQQEPVLFSESIAANLHYGRPDADEAAMWQALEHAEAATFVRALPQGLQTPVGERGVQLSGGQKQRIAIARALLRDPRILILDEATSALDAETEHHLQRALDRLMQGRTVLLIAHRLSTVRRADQVLVVQAGRVVERGTHESLLEARGVYHALVQRQMEHLTLG
jgi:ATP-binding cassette subfamily B protein